MVGPKIYGINVCVSFKKKVLVTNCVEQELKNF